MKEAIAPQSAAPAQLAKHALRHLVEQRLDPTPDNYRAAWLAVGGKAEGLVPAARAGETRGADARQAAARGSDAPDHDWAGIVRGIVRGLETNHPGWTSARKKESLTRVLQGAGGNTARLGERLSKLVASWGGREEGAGEGIEPAPSATDVSPAPTAAAPVTDVSPAPAPALPAAAGAIVAGEITTAGCDECPRQLSHANRIAEELRLTLTTLCESIPAMLEEESWLAGQFTTIRQLIETAPDRRTLANARSLLLQSAQTQRALADRRRESLHQLKRTLADWIAWIGGLAASTDGFGQRISGYAEEIERSGTVAALADTVGHLLRDAREMHAGLDRSRREFESARDQALRLQGEVARLEGALAEASSQVVTDHLTCLMNRRGLAASFEQMQSRRAPGGSPLALALIDVDDFKKLNDTLGHHAGDDALRHLAGVLREKLRPGDICARYGGEEFVLLLPGAAPDRAAEVVTRLQRELTRHVFMHESSRVFITFSAGVADVGTGEAMEDVLARADDAMYAAKRSGKNRVEVSRSGGS